MSTPVIDYTGNIIESARAHFRYVEHLRRTSDTIDKATREPQERDAPEESGGFEEWS